MALIAAGLCRSRNAAHAMVAALCAVAVAALAWFATGFAWQGFPGGAARVLTIAGKSWSWIGSEPLWMRGVADHGVPANSAMLLGMMGAAMAAVIPLSSGGERWRLGATCLSSALLAGVTFPLFSHWAWGGGWLADIGFVDYGGGATIHARWRRDRAGDGVGSGTAARQVFARGRAVRISGA